MGKLGRVWVWLLFCSVPSIAASLRAEEPAEKAVKADAPAADTENPAPAAPAVPALAPAPAAQPPAPAVPAPAQEGSQKVRFSFKDADWGEVFQWLADLTGKSLVQEASPPGKFNYFDTRSFTLPEAMDVINSVLLTKGFALLERDNFLVVADLREGIPPHLVQRVSIEDLPKKGRTELVKVLVTLEGLVAEEAKKEFEPMKGPHGSVLALPTTNQLLLIDTAKNAQQIVELIRAVEGDQGKADLKAFPLKHVSAVEVERVVRDLLGIAPRQATPGAGPPSDARGGGGGGEGDGRDRFREMILSRFLGGGGGGPPDGGDRRGRDRGVSDGRSGAQAQPGGKGPFVAVDERTNTIFVTATPDKLALVSQVVKALDVAQDGDGKERQAQTPRIEVYPVASGTADGVAKVMESIVGSSPEARISAHPDGRALIVYATPREHERLRVVLEELRSEGLKVEVIPLRTLEAASTVQLIKALLGQKEQDTSRNRFPFFFDRDSQRDQSESVGPALEADTEQNRLLVRGTEPQIAEIRDLLAKLGETGLARGGAGGLEPSRYRVVPLGDRDPAELVETIERLWNRIESKNPLRIEVLPQPPAPNGPNRSQEKRDPAPSERNTGEPLSGGGGGGGDDPPLEPAPNQPEARSEPEASPVPEAGKPVTIVVGPDNLAIASDDPEALELVESLISSLIRNRGGSAGGFGIYYLKAASAQDMAYLLDEALYGQRDPLETTTVAATRARIIPDKRTNSLLVVGPASEQKKVEQLLEVLDRSDPPPTQATPQPGLIPVRYARASDLAAVVRDVFAAQLYSPPKQNPAQSALGFANNFGGQGRNRQADQEPGKLTVGVDEQTNTIIVSAPRDLFMAIEKLVLALDESSRDNHRTARVVTLKNARPEAVQKALGNLLGTRQPGDLRKKPDKKDETPADQAQPDVRDEILRSLIPGGPGRDGGGGGGGDFFRDRGRGRFGPFPR